MERFHPVYLNKDDHKIVDVLAMIARILLTPVGVLVKIYHWVWD